VGGVDLVNIGPLSGTSTTVTLPTLGATIYVTLESQFDGKTVDIPYTYTEASQVAASITSPANGSTLTGATTTFLWTMNGSTAPVYLHVGTTVGGVDLVNIGPITGGSTTVTLPTLGATIYVTLESQVNGKTVDVPYTYTEASQAAASITSPANGSQLGSTQTFTWVYNGSTDPVYLHIGSTPGGIDIVNIGPITGGSTTVNLPTDGATVYVTLESQVNGQTVDVPYTYTDPTSASPSNNSRNPNATRKK
jgi:D-alanyl-D-alanine dipeptidase